MNDENSSTECDFLHLPASFETKIYKNNSGGITIEQEDPYCSETPSIALTKSQVYLVVKSLQEYLES